DPGPPSPLNNNNNNNHQMATFIKALGRRRSCPGESAKLIDKQHLRRQRSRASSLPRMQKGSLSASENGEDYARTNKRLRRSVTLAAPSRPKDARLYLYFYRNVTSEF